MFGYDRTFGYRKNTARIPTSGLQGLWLPVRQRNLLKYSEDFSQSAWGLGRITKFGTNAFLETTESGMHHIIQNPFLWVENKTYTLIAKIKGIGRKRCFLYTSSGTNRSAAFDLEAIITLGKEPGFTKSSIQASSDGYCIIAATLTMPAGSVSGYFSIGVLLDNGDYNNVSFVGDTTKGLEIAWAQVEEGDVFTGYESTTNLQTVSDFSGKGTHGFIGTNNGSTGDTNDPAWTGKELTFGGDDFATVPYIDMGLTDEFTVGFIGKVKRHTAIQTLTGKNNWTSGDSNYGFYFYASIAGNLSLGGGASGAEEVSSASSAYIIPDAFTLVHLAAALKNNFRPKFYVNGVYVGDGNNTLVYADNPTQYFYMGKYGTASTYPQAGSTVQGAYLFNRVLSAAEVTKAHKYFQRELAKRGVILP